MQVVIWCYVKYCIRLHSYYVKHSLEYSQRHSVISHCDRHITHLGDLIISYVSNISSKISLHLECYLPSPKRHIKISKQIKQIKRYISITKKSDTSMTVIYHNMSLTVLYQESIEKNTLTITFRLCQFYVNESVVNRIKVNKILYKICNFTWFHCDNHPWLQWLVTGNAECVMDVHTQVMADIVRTKYLSFLKIERILPFTWLLKRYQLVQGEFYVIHVVVRLYFI